MALRFQPYNINVDNNNDRTRFQQTVLDPIGQGLGLIAQSQEYKRQLERQRMLDEYAQQDRALKMQQMQQQYGTPIDPSIQNVSPYAQSRPVQSSIFPGQQIQAAQPSPLIERFNQWRAQGMSPKTAEPDFMPALGQYEQKQYQQQFQPKDSSNGYFIPRGVDPQTNRPVYSHSKQIGMFYDDMTPYKGTALGGLNLKPLPSEQITAETQLDNLKYALDKIKSTYSPDLVGPASARIGRGKQYIEGMAIPEAADFYASVGDLRNQIIYLRSGKQINEAEYKRLMDTLPNEYLAPTDFEQKMKYVEGMLNSILESRQRTLSGSGYRVPSPRSSTPSATPPPSSSKEEIKRKLGL